jgi:hypothetical protein
MSSIKPRNLKVLIAASLLFVSAVAHAVWTGTQTGWSPLTPSNGVSSSAALYYAGGPGKPRRLFFLDTSNNVAFRAERPDATWEPTASLGGPFNTPPAAAAWNVDNQIVVARFSDSAYWYKKFIPGTYTIQSQGWEPNWHSLGGGFVSAPAVTAKGAGRYFFAGVGLDNHIWSGYLTASGFTGWSQMEVPHFGGQDIQTLYAPAAFASTSGHIELVMIGNTRRMYMITWDDTWGVWSSWEDLGGQFTSSPAFAFWSSSDYVVVGAGTDGQVWRSRFSHTNPLGTPWELLPGGAVLSGSGLAAISRTTLQYEVVAEGTNHGLFINKNTE